MIPEILSAKILPCCALMLTSREKDARRTPLKHTARGDVTAILGPMP
jgi:hypothetical protein